MLSEFKNQIKNPELSTKEIRLGIYFFSKSVFKANTNKNIAIITNNPWTAFGDLSCKASAKPKSPDHQNSKRFIVSKQHGC